MLSPLVATASPECAGAYSNPNIWWHDDERSDIGSCRLPGNMSANSSRCVCTWLYTIRTQTRWSRAGPSCLFRFTARSGGPAIERAPGVDRFPPRSGGCEAAQGSDVVVRMGHVRVVAGADVDMAFGLRQRRSHLVQNGPEEGRALVPLGQDRRLREARERV